MNRPDSMGADAPRLDAVLRVMDADPNATYYPGRTGTERERTDVPVIVADWNRVPADLANRVESDGFEIDWADEVCRCDDCGHAIEMQPSHAFWSPSYAWDDDAAGYVCFACLGSAGLRWAPASHYSPVASGYVVINPEEWRNRSISSGTMRPEDIVPAMVSALRELGYAYGYWADAHREFRTIQETDDRLAAAILHEGEDALGWLWDRLDDVAPEGCTFGYHPDDGADLGFWEAEEC